MVAEGERMICGCSFFCCSLDGLRSVELALAATRRLGRGVESSLVGALGL